MCSGVLGIESPDRLREECEGHPPLLAVSVGARFAFEKGGGKGGRHEIAHFAVSGSDGEFEVDGIARRADVAEWIWTIHEADGDNGEGDGVKPEEVWRVTCEVTCDV